MLITLLRTICAAQTRFSYTERVKKQKLSSVLSIEIGDERDNKNEKTERKRNPFFLLLLTRDKLS